MQDTQPDPTSELSRDQSSVGRSDEQFTQDESRVFDPNSTSEVSFSLGQAAISSTPARHKAPYEQDESTPSWSASVESPLVRLDREIHSLTEENEGAVASSLVSHSRPQYDDNSEDLTQRQIPQDSVADASLLPSADKSRGKSPGEPLLRSILRRNADVSVAANRTITGTSPLKVKGKTPISKTLNPYLPPNTKPSDWKGVVDLTDPRIATPGRHTASSKKRQLNEQSSNTGRPATPKFNVEDESFDEGLGMSPPIMMDFARLPKAKTPQLGRTPRKEAAHRIAQNLVDVEKSSSTFSSARINAIFTRPVVDSASNAESSVSTVPSPPSLSKYTRGSKPSAAETSSSLADASLESMMRRVGLNVSGFDPGDLASNTGNTESYGTVPTSTFLPPIAAQGAPSEPQNNPRMPVIDFSRVRVDDDEYGIVNASMDSDDSFEEANNTANPSAAFLMAAQRPSFDEDDSFDSNDGDSMDFADVGDMANPHPFGNVMADQEGDSFDDSFDNDPVFDQQTEEETLFGVAPAQRLQAHAAYENRMSMGHLHMHGQGLLEDTLGVGAQMAQAGHAENTPTPASGMRS